MTALPIVALAGRVARWPLHPAAARRAPGGGGGPASRTAPGACWRWIVAWELVEYLARGSRGAHPTLSSMADALDRPYVLKAAVFFGWLCLGALIVRLGTAAGPVTSTGFYAVWSVLGAGSSALWAPRWGRRRPCPAPPCCAAVADRAAPGRCVVRATVCLPAGHFFAADADSRCWWWGSTARLGWHLFAR